MLHIMTLVCVLLWPYQFCYFATLATDRITIIQRSVYDLNWYEFPLKLRKCFILIMAQSQWTVYFDGLGVVYCTLANFGMVEFDLIAQFPHVQYIDTQKIIQSMDFNWFAAHSVSNFILYGIWFNIKSKHVIRLDLENWKLSDAFPIFFIRPWIDILLQIWSKRWTSAQQKFDSLASLPLNFRHFQHTKPAFNSTPLSSEVFNIINYVSVISIRHA